MTMMIDGVCVDELWESDTCLRWDFTVDHDTFYRVKLAEGGNNLRVWVSRPDMWGFTPLEWLLPEDPARPALDEYGPDVEVPIASFVREQIAATIKGRSG